jgi:hypothetical protein
MIDFLIYALIAWIFASIILAPIFGHLLSHRSDLYRPPPHHHRRNHK